MLLSTRSNDVWWLVSWLICILPYWLFTLSVSLSNIAMIVNIHKWQLVVGCCWASDVVVVVNRADRFIYFFLSSSFMQISWIPKSPTCLQIRACLHGPQAFWTWAPTYTFLKKLIGPQTMFSARGGLQIEICGLMAGSRTQQAAFPSPAQSSWRSQKVPGCPSETPALQRPYVHCHSQHWPFCVQATFSFRQWTHRNRWQYFFSGQALCALHSCE